MLKTLLNVPNGNEYHVDAGKMANHEIDCKINVEIIEN